MSELRRLIVDTDTGSDDVWAVVEALRATDVVKVEAVTVVCGNLPLDLCVKNAMLAEDAAGTYAPPVYRGMERPLMSREALYAPEVHGPDGLGGMDLPQPERAAESKRACEAIIDLVMAHPGEMEIATIGPLTNLAMALLLEPRLAENVKKLWILGGSVSGRGNLTDTAEYNVGVDPEAASIVLDSGVPSVWVTLDATRGETELAPAELAALRESGDPAGRFCAACIRSMQAWQKRKYGRESVGVIDSLLMTAALYPEIMEDVFPARCEVERAPGGMRGFFRIDRAGAPNAEICPRVDAAAYKKHLFRLLGAGANRNGYER